MVDVIARAAVEIEPDISAFARKLKADLNAIGSDITRSMSGIDKSLSKIGTSGGNAFEQVERSSKKATKGIVIGWRQTATGIEEVFAEIPKAAKKSSEKTRDELSKISASAKKMNADIVKTNSDSSSSFLSLGGNVFKLAGIFTKVVSVGSTLGTLIPITAALAQTLAATAGAAAIIPGALAAIAAPIAVLKIAFIGIADAISADNAKELEEALKKLPKPAQEFVKAVRHLKDQFEGVRRAIQSTFFAGLDKKLDDLGNFALPILTRGLVGIASELNGVVKGFSDMLIKQGGVVALSSILESARTATRNLGLALIPITEALLAIADVGAEVFAELTGGAQKAGEKFRDFIKEAKESGKLKQFMEDGIAALKVLWGILSDIVAIVGNIFRPLLEGTGELKTPLIEILDIFRQFTASTEFVNLMRELGKIFMMLAEAVGTVFKAALDAIMPVLTELLTKLGDHMAKILPDLIPALETLIGFFGDLLLALLPLLDPIFKLVQVLLPPLAELFKRVIATIDMEKITQLAEKIGTTLVDAIIKLQPKIEEIITKLGDLWEKMSPLIDSFLDFALVTIPPMIDALTFVIDVILHLISFAIDPLIAAWNVLSFVVSTVWNGIKAVVTQNIEDIKATFSGLGSIIDRVKEIFGNVRDAIRDKFQEAVEWVKGIPQRIRDGLGDTGRMLFDAGARIVGGLIDGLKAKVADAGRAAADIAAKVKSFFPFSPAKEGPLSGTGYVTFSGQRLVEDFARSLRNTSAISAAARNMMAAATAPLDVGITRSSINGLTTRAGGGAAGAIAQQVAAASARAGVTESAGGGDVAVQVFIGQEELTSLVTDVVVDRDRRVKRAVNAGARRVS